MVSKVRWAMAKWWLNRLPQSPLLGRAIVARSPVLVQRHGSAIVVLAWGLRALETQWSCWGLTLQASPWALLAQN